MANPKTSSQFNTFGSFAQDGNRVPLSNFPNTISTQDATASPQASPLALTTSLTDIKIPVAAVNITMTPSATIRYTEDSTGTRYATLAANATLTIPCTRLTDLYVRGDAGAATLQFFFSVV